MVRNQLLGVIGKVGAPTIRQSAMCISH